MKKKLLYYSDCYIFGGCEALLVNLIRSKAVAEQYDVCFAHAKNKDYEAGVALRLDGFANRFPLRILGNANLFWRLDMRGWNKYLTYPIKLPFVVFDMFGVYALYNFIRLYFFFSRRKPDILHINNGGYPGAASCRIAVFSAKAAGIRHIIFTVNNQARDQAGSIDKFMDRFLARSVDFFTTASALARNMLIQKRGTPPANVVQIYNSANQDVVGRDREKVLREFGLPVDSFVIVCVAYFNERKGHKFIVTALDDLRQKNRELFDKAIVFFVGDGEYQPVINNIIADRGLADKIFMPGFRTDYCDFINAADLFILPSYKDEDMPLAVLSAMGLGKAIISTRVGGILEEIRDGRDGVLLDPSDLHRLSSVIEELYRDPLKRKRLGDSAKERYHELFTVEKVTEAYLHLYRFAADGNPSPNGG